jgi:hypothetical protein
MEAIIIHDGKTSEGYEEGVCKSQRRSSTGCAYVAGVINRFDQRVWEPCDLRGSTLGWLSFLPLAPPSASLHLQNREIAVSL